jgi:hypothetical protein
MPWWVVLYFSLYITFCLWSLVGDFRDKSETASAIGIEAIADICMVIAGLSFWIPPLQRMPWSVLAVLVVVGSALYLWQMALGLRKHVVQDPDIPREERIFVGLVGSGMSVLITAPLLVWAISSLLRRGTGT